MQKGFIVSYQNINDRFDPEFYQPKYSSLRKSLTKNGAKKLGSIIRFSSEIWDQKQFFEDEFPYIEISEINITSGKINKINFIKKTNAPSRAKKIVRKNDILISTTRPHRGAITLIGENHDFKIASTGFSVIRDFKNNSLVSREFLYLMLRQQFCLNQLKQRSSGGNYPAITEEELKKILIPVPPQDQQKKIEALFDEAFSSKAQKEAEAQELLNGIDDYLLSELDITLPEKDNSLQNRIFETSFQNVSGRRYDPKPYDNHSQDLFNAISNSKYPKTPLKKLVIHSASGKWGKSTNSNAKEKKYQKCLVIRATEFDNLYNLKLENDRAKYRLIKKRHLKKLDIRIKDLLIEKSGGSPDQPVGRIALLRKDLVENNTLCFSNFVHKIRVDVSQILPEYLFSFLKTIHNIKITEIMQSQTSGIRNLIMGEYFNQEIVIPEKSKQRKIAGEIKRRRFRAQGLERQARQEVENARQKVEKMILEKN